MLRRERDQNKTIRWTLLSSSIPDCSGGSEIKTRRSGGRCCPLRYQIAPEGARSKPGIIAASSAIHDTRLLRRERDQNIIPLPQFQVFKIPDCSGGSEIKTQVAPEPSAGGGYQIAPEGARSKLHHRLAGANVLDTRLLRRERDQNKAAGALTIPVRIPDCSGGSEIKTIWARRSKKTRRYQIAPEGARSKLDGRQRRVEAYDTRLLRRERDQNSFPPRAVCDQRYQIASEGARSKRLHVKAHSRIRDTRLLRRERDQNAARCSRFCSPSIPDCSGGSEIKTGRLGCFTRSFRYQIAPEGARSKR